MNRTAQTLDLWAVTEVPRQPRQPESEFARLVPDELDRDRAARRALAVYR